MFIKWIKSNYSKYGLEEYSKKWSSNYRINNICNFSLLLLFCWSNYRNYYNKYSSYIKTNFFFKEQTPRFFIDYANHSKDIAKILKNGYGNQEIFGSINDLEIKFPEKPKIEDIGISNKHLEKDYPDIWKMKEELFTHSEQYLKIIENTIEQFKIKTKKTITDNTDFKEYLNTRSSLEELLTNQYFYSGIYIETFKMIQNHTNRIDVTWDVTGNHPNEILNVRSHSSGDTLFSTRNNPSTNNDYENIVNRIIQLLKDNTELNNLVKQYEKEQFKFYTNNERTAFFEQIDGLYDKIVNQGCSMNTKEKCIRCPNMSWIDTF